MTHPTPYPDVNAVLPSHPYLAIIFDMGGVLMDWNPRHLYRKLFDGDSDSQYQSPEQLATELCRLIDRFKSPPQAPTL